MAEFHLAPNGAASSVLVAPVPASPGAPLITHEQLQGLYDLMLQYQLADAALEQIFRRKKWPAQLLPQLQHPAVSAGLFSNLRDGDIVGASSYAFTANLATEASLSSALRGVIAQAKSAKPARKAIRLQPAEQLAAVTGAALTQQINGDNIVIAFPAGESWHNDKSSASVLRWAGEKHLPILYVTFARNLPGPGQSQSSLGLPQIAVDANDVVAVYRVAQECFYRARTGVGPTWIQCVVSQKSDRSEPLYVMQKFLEARKLFQAARKTATAKAWREQWKQAWHAASVASHEPPSTLPIRTFDGGN